MKMNDAFLVIAAKDNKIKELEEKLEENVKKLQSSQGKEEELTKAYESHKAKISEEVIQHYLFMDWLLNLVQPMAIPRGCEGEKSQQLHGPISWKGYYKKKNIKKLLINPDWRNRGKESPTRHGNLAGESTNAWRNTGQFLPAMPRLSKEFCQIYQTI